MTDFQEPAENIELEYVVKKSRFITRVAKAESREAALAVVQQARQDYPDARHHCWAYLLGSSAAPLSQAFSDDGEPSGTAGKPMLNVLQHKPVGNVVVVVIRYFGGIKLGAGGLVRAYSQAVQQAYEEMEVQPVITMTALALVLDFAHESQLRYLLDQACGEIVSLHYSEQLRVNVLVPANQQAVFKRELRAIATIIAES